MNAQTQWYDSTWLAAWFSARKVVQRVAPSRYDEFIHAFDVFRTPSSFAPRFMQGLLEPDELAAIRKTVAAVPNSQIKMHELADFGRFVVHDLPEFTELQNRLTDQVAVWASEPVEPSYNFLSIYTQLGACEPHLDAPPAKWTLDLCIDQSDPWPIHFSQIVEWPEGPVKAGRDWQQAIRNDPALRFTTHTMEPGDAVLFSGSSQWHYRNPLPRDGRKRTCTLLFLHFIPRGTAELVVPANWARLFGIAELADIPGIGEAL